MQALRNTILVKLDPMEDMTKGGIALHPISQERAIIGEIISIGSGRVTDKGVTVPCDFEVGQRVLIRRWCGDYVGDVKDNIIAVFDHDIQGVVE